MYVVSYNYNNLFDVNTEIAATVHATCRNTHSSVFKSSMYFKRTISSVFQKKENIQ